MKIKIRKAKLEDLPRVLFVTNLAYKAPYKPETPITKPHQPKDIKEKFLKKELAALVVLVDDKIVGAVKYRIKENNLYFYQLAILKTFRNNGIANLLLGEIEKIAKKKGLNKIQLDCLKEKKLPEYYKKLGYKIDKTEKHNGFQEVFMSKSLQ